MFQRILVPLDGSFRAEQALPIAARIARSTGGSLLLVQVVSPLIDYSGGLSPVSLVNDQVYEAELVAATNYLKSLATSSELSGIKIKTEVLFGLPVQRLLALAKAPASDLIVMCSHGRTGLTRWVLGSVAHALVYQCTLPILVLRQDRVSSPLSHFHAAGPLHTLVPLDGSPLAEAVLCPAAYLTAALAGAFQGALHLSQVVKIFPSTAQEGFVSEFNEEALQRAGIYLSQVEERMKPEMKDLQLSLTHSVELASDVVSALVKLAEHGKVDKEGAPEEKVAPCDLIAISTHGRGGLERWVIGSVVERLLHATKLPLLIVRPPKEGEEGYHA